MIRISQVSKSNSNSLRHLTNDFQHSSTGVLASLVDGAARVLSRVFRVDVMNGQHTSLLVHVKFVGWLHVISTAVPKDRRLGDP